MDRSPRRDLPGIPVRVLVACVFLLGVLGSLWGVKCGKAKKVVPATYEEELEAIRQRYRPLIAEYNEVWRPKSKEVREQWWRENVGQPRDAEISAIRRKYNRPDFPQTPPPTE